MIITCTSCSTRLQVEDEKAPVGAFTIRCPKCRNLVKAKREVPNDVDLSSRQRPTGGLDKPKSAPVYKPSAPVTHNQTINSVKSVQATANVTGGDSNSNQLLQALTALLQQGVGTNNVSAHNPRYDWERQRALVCVEEQHREKIASLLSERHYQVYIAADKIQAVERMHEEKMNLVVLSPLFDEQNMGEGTVRQEFDSMRPADRRRLFVVLFTELQKTMDNHASFLENVNLIVNPKDIEALPRALEISMRTYNELYHNFNDALGIGPVG